MSFECHVPVRCGGRQVEVDLGLNAASNARVRHEARKRHTAKQRRTVEANARALAAAEKRTTQQLAQVRFRPRRDRAGVRGEKQVGVPAHDIHRAARWRLMRFGASQVARVPSPEHSILLR